MANMSCIFTTITSSTIYKIHTEKEEGMEHLGGLLLHATEESLDGLVDTKIL